MLVVFFEVEVMEFWGVAQLEVEVELLVVFFEVEVMEFWGVAQLEVEVMEFWGIVHSEVESEDKVADSYEITDLAS
jgi:hypothetical protein